MILDLGLWVADLPAAAPYSMRRARYAGGEVVDTWINQIPGWGSYGIRVMADPQWRIIRILDAQEGDDMFLTYTDPITIPPHMQTESPRRRERRLRLQDMDVPTRTALEARLMPDVDLMLPELRDIYIAKVPGIENLRKNQRRSTVWDAVLPRAEIFAFVEDKPIEARDGNGKPVEGTPLERHGFMTDDR